MHTSLSKTLRQTTLEWLVLALLLTLENAFKRLPLQVATNLAGHFKVCSRNVKEYFATSWAGSNGARKMQISYSDVSCDVTIVIVETLLLLKQWLLLFRGFQIGKFRILTVGLNQTWNRGLCGQINLHLKIFARISLHSMLDLIRPWEFENGLFEYHECDFNVCKQKISLYALGKVQSNWDFNNNNLEQTVD